MIEILKDMIMRKIENKYDIYQANGNADYLFRFSVYNRAPLSSYKGILLFYNEGISIEVRHNYVFKTYKYGYDKLDNIDDIIGLFDKSIYGWDLDE